MNVDTALTLVLVVAAIVSPSAGLVFLEPTSDTLEGARHAAIPPIDSATDGYFEDNAPVRPECNTSDDQYVGVVQKGEEAFEEDLEAMGFEQNPIACLKEQETSGAKEVGSFRYTQGDYQVHVVIYDRGEPDTTYIYAHWEYRWDRHPIKHYREDEFSDEKGVERTKELLDEHNVTYSEDGHPKDL